MSGAPYSPPRLRELRTDLCRRKDRYRVYLGRRHPWSNASGWQWRARLLVMLHLGRLLLTDEQVDHVNLDRKDDRIENFRVWLMTKGWNHHFWRAEMALIAEWVEGEGFLEYDEPQPLELPF